MGKSNRYVFFFSIRSISPILYHQGLSQSSKDDIGVCVVIISITILAVIITIIKIVLFDISAYPELFGSSSSDSTSTPKNNTSEKQ